LAAVHGTRNESWGDTTMRVASSTRGPDWLWAEWRGRVQVWRGVQEESFGVLGPEFKEVSWREAVGRVRVPSAKYDQPSRVRSAEALVVPREFGGEASTF